MPDAVNSPRIEFFFPLRRRQSVRQFGFPELTSFLWEQQKFPAHLTHYFLYLTVPPDT